MMKKFIDYSGFQILLSKETEQHIAFVHSEIDIASVRKALSDPDEVRRSSHHSSSKLYYRVKSLNRFICVVVKICTDGRFISSAMTTSKPKSGEVIYVRRS
jgi:hypothetical protein